MTTNVMDTIRRQANEAKGNDVVRYRDLLRTAARGDFSDEAASELRAIADRLGKDDARIARDLGVFEREAVLERKASDWSDADAERLADVQRELSAASHEYQCRVDDIMRELDEEYGPTIDRLKKTAAEMTEREKRTQHPRESLHKLRANHGDLFGSPNEPPAPEPEPIATGEFMFEPSSKQRVHLLSRDQIRGIVASVAPSAVLRFQRWADRFGGDTEHFAVQITAPIADRPRIEAALYDAEAARRNGAALDESLEQDA